MEQRLSVRNLDAMPLRCLVPLLPEQAAARKARFLEAMRQDRSLIDSRLEAKIRGWKDVAGLLEGIRERGIEIRHSSCREWHEGSRESQAGELPVLLCLDLHGLARSFKELDEYLSEATSSGLVLYASGVSSGAPTSKLRLEARGDQPAIVAKLLDCIAIERIRQPSLIYGGLATSGQSGSGWQITIEWIGWTPSAAEIDLLVRCVGVSGAKIEAKQFCFAS